MMMLTALAWALLTPTRAYAADDQIDSFVIDYNMQPSGVLKVKETITWRFGSNSGRHGIQRDLVTREPDPNSDQGLRLRISNITVTSPDPNVATQFSSKTTESQGGREAELNVRIGDPDETISAPTATYVISYDVTGAMRSFSGYDEFFWDGPGFGNPLIKDLKITTTVPGGVQDATCFYGPPRSTDPCETDDFTKGGKATFGQTNVAPGASVSTSVKITPGLVADNKPHMEPNGAKLSPAERVGALRWLASRCSSSSPPRLSACCGGARTAAINATPACRRVQFRSLVKRRRSCRMIPTFPSRSRSLHHESPWRKLAC
jgi:hypothetical protein